MKRYSLFLLLCLGFAACHKAKDIQGYFTLQGKMVQDCSGTQIANQPVYISFRAPSGYTQYYKDSIGGGVTDAAGNFSFQCENHGDGNININLGYTTGLSPYAIVSDYIVKPANNGNLNVGTIYQSYTTSSYVKISSATSHLNDTLYFGDSPQSTDTVFGFDKTYVRVHNYGITGGSGIPSKDAFYDVWGIGAQEYNSAVSHLTYNSNDTTSSAHAFRVFYNACSAHDTTYVYLP